MKLYLVPMFFCIRKHQISTSIKTHSVPTLKSVKLYLRSSSINDSRLNCSSYLLNLESQLITLS